MLAAALALTVTATGVGASSTLAPAQEREVITAIATAPHIDASAYLLDPGNPVLSALERSAARGHNVTVVLPADPYDPTGFVTSRNDLAEASLTRAGAHVALSRRPLHMKAVVANGTAYLDDTNFAQSSASLLVADSQPADVGAVESALRGAPYDTADLETTKGSALIAEARVVRAARSWVAVASESFGYRNPVYDALLVAARRGIRVSVAVAAREARSRYEQTDLRALVAAGAHVRVVDADEKLAASDSGAWIGSANATHGLPEQIDWGLLVTDPTLTAAIVDHLRRLEEQ